MSTGILFSDASISSPSVNNVRIHPLVVFQMADSFERAQPCQRKGDSNSKNVTWVKKDQVNNDKQEEHDDKTNELYSIGVLYGNIIDHTAIVLDSFACVPCAGTGDAVDMTLFSRMNTRHREMFPKEDVIGYYTFGTKNIEWSSVIPQGGSGIHIWVSPITPPKIDCFSVSHHGDKLIFLPIEYTVEASAEEQMGLSRLADQTVAEEESATLQAGVRELRSLLQSVGNFCRNNRSTCMKDNIIGRRIYVAIQQARMNNSSLSVLQENIAAIDRFINELSAGDVVVGEAEKAMALPLD